MVAFIIDFMMVILKGMVARGYRRPLPAWLKSLDLWIKGQIAGELGLEEKVEGRGGRGGGGCCQTVALIAERAGVLCKHNTSETGASGWERVAGEAGRLPVTHWLLTSGVTMLHLANGGHFVREEKNCRFGTRVKQLHGEGAGGSEGQKMIGREVERSQFKTLKTLSPGER